MAMEYWPSRKEVLEMISAAWSPTLESEQVPVGEAAGRVAAEDIYTAFGLPVVRASAMDGIGVEAIRFRDGGPDTSTWRSGTEYARTDTGDDFDDRYDAVIPIEMITMLPDGGIRIDPSVRVTAGMNIRPGGSYFQKGDLAVKQWTRLTPSDLAAMVMGGITSAAVVKRPVVAFIPTGSELIPAGRIPGRGNNLDSNSILAEQMLKEMGAEPLCLPIVRDDKQELAAVLETALGKADIVILNGGSSKGGEDYNAELLKEKGRLLCHNIAAAPGRPMCIAVIKGKMVINLPGPSIACYYGMDWCVRAVVNTFLHQEPPVRGKIPVKLTEEIRYHKGMEILCKMEIQKTAKGYEGRQAPFRASTVIDNLIAPAQFITDPERDHYEAGEIIEVELLRDIK